MTRYIDTLMEGNENRCPQLGDAGGTRADAPGAGTARGPHRSHRMAQPDGGRHGSEMMAGL